MTVEAHTTDAPSAPDWSATTEPVRCPLCDYDLRGLVEPRCPECGYRFTWREVVDDVLHRHRYLFEHHPRRNVWSFVRTMLGGLRPARFWSSLKPGQPLRPGRLVLYWLISASLLPLGYAAAFSRTAAAHAPEYRQKRAAAIRYATRMRPGQPLPEYVDEMFPAPLSLGYVRTIYRHEYRYHFGRHLRVALLYVLWPWLTLAVLLIFVASMRRAKVRTIHVLRCVLYCCDTGLWLGTAAVLAAPWLMRELDLGRYLGYRVESLAVLLLAPVTAWRLSAAYRHYLRFDHPTATAAASQVVVTLAVWVFLYAVLA